MSSFVLGADHIDLMVSYALYDLGAADPLQGLITGKNGKGRFLRVVADHSRLTLDSISATELGRLLLTQNVRSVVVNYDSAGTTELEGYSKFIAGYFHRPVQLFRLAEAQRLEADVIRACRCYDYQSCDSGDLSTTEAGQWSELILRKAAGAIADRYSEVWEWSRGQLSS